MGRLAVTVPLDALDAKRLRRILTEPHDALVRQYQALFAMDGCRLVFTSEALQLVAEEALAAGTGARGLRSVLERVLLEPMYAATDGELVISGEDVAGTRGGLRRTG
ncbi:MAG: hypothetical protein U5L11_01510 [Arhodomonas sp.]|nr:hypothetical protein [Arhodomonas sp.]